MKSYVLLLLALTSLFNVISAQESYAENPKEWMALKNERGYNILSGLDTVCYAPLLVYGIYGMDGFIGLIDDKGKELTPAKFHEIDGLTSIMGRGDDHYTVRIGENYGLIDMFGKQVLPLEEGYLSTKEYTLDSDAYITRIGQIERSTRYKKTVIDLSTGEVVKETTYSEEDYEVIELVDSDGLYALEMETLKDGSDFADPVNTEPRQKPKPSIKFHEEYGDKQGYIQKGVYTFKNKTTGLVGVIDMTDMSVIIPQEYDQIHRLFQSTNYRIVKNGKYGLLDSNLNIMVEPEWDVIREFQKSYAVKKGDFYAVYSSDFKKLSKFDYIISKPLNHGMAVVDKVLDKDSNEVFLNINGNEVLDFPHEKFTLVVNENDGLMVMTVKTDKGWFLSDIEGKPLLKDYFDDIVPEKDVSSEEGSIYREGFGFYQNSDNKGFYVLKDKKWGFIDKNYKLTIPPQYNRLGESYIKDMLYVKGETGWGAVNSRTGEVMIPLEYRICPKYSGGLIRVVVPNKVGYYRKDGTLFLSPAEGRSDYIDKIYSGLYRIPGRKTGAQFVDDEGGVMDTGDLKW